MHPLFASRRHTDAPDQRRGHEYAVYLARQMGPMIHALMLMGAFAYVVGTAAHAFLSASPIPLWVRLAPAALLLLVASATRRVQRPLSLSLLALLCLLLLEIGINLNGIGRIQGQPWVLPGLLLPVASSMIWPGRWDFIGAMLLCALGPLPMLLLGAGNSVLVLQYVVYMTIAISLSAVLRAFMARTLFAQFQLERQLREQANTDGLTGLLLRNRFLELARLTLADAHHHQQPVCMLYLDADHFKQLNDNHGHAAGDAALIAMAAAMRRHMRQTDLIGRIGGEEFAMLLPGVDRQQASHRAEQLRMAVRAVRRPDGPLTVSIGIAECTDSYCDDIEALLARADMAMRQAKLAGRDQAVSA